MSTEARYEVQYRSDFQHIKGQWASMPPVPTLGAAMAQRDELRKQPRYDGVEFRVALVVSVVVLP